MLGILSIRPKPPIVTELAFTHGSAYQRLATNKASLVSVLRGETYQRLFPSCSEISGCASSWRAIFPSAREYHRHNLVHPFNREQKGEGSWNVAWDVRPARWLHSDSAWFLFGVCACLAAAAAPKLDFNFESAAAATANDDIVSTDNNKDTCDKPIKYRVIGVPGDGRCLFRAVTYGACLKCAEEVPDENHQRELADDLRARVAEELLKRRDELEWIVEGDFDMYVKSIQRPNAWGGEPELLMASHVLRKPISVFMIDRRSGELVNIASYGPEYKKEQGPIQVLFHGYGHYDVLEIYPERSC